MYSSEVLVEDSRRSVWASGMVRGYSFQQRSALRYPDFSTIEGTNFYLLVIHPPNYRMGW